jgi:hypothetical protein
MGFFGEMMSGKIIQKGGGRSPRAKRGADRGRNETLVCPAPPSEPDLQISRIRLSS